MDTCGTIRHIRIKFLFAGQHLNTYLHSRNNHSVYRLANAEKINLQEKIMSENEYDLVILGSGSTAFAAALRVQEFGKNGRYRN